MRYVQETASGAEAAPAVERMVASVKLPPEPQPIINYILGGSIDDQYQSKHHPRQN